VATEENTSSSLGEHPDLETLFDYLVGKLTLEEADRLREHLASCPGCCDRLLAAEIYEAPAEETGIEAAERATVWSRVEERIASSASVPMPFHRRPPFLPWALAASLLLASVGLSFRLVSLQSQVAELSSPSTAAVVDLLPDGELVRGEPAGEVKLSQDSHNIVLILHTFELRSFSGYKILLKDGARTIWSDSGLKPDRDGYFALTIPEAWYSTAAARLRFELYGQVDGQEELIGTYSARFK